MVTGGVKAVAAGHSHSMILKQDGSVWATGSNVHGQLGDGSTTDRQSFVKVKSSVTAVAAGFGHSMVLTQDGVVWATGWNLHGQFGDGSITSTNDFIRVAKLSDSVVPDAVTTTENWLSSDPKITTVASLTGAKCASVYHRVLYDLQICVLCCSCTV